MVNPYGNGTAATTITRVLTTVDLDGLLIKQPTPLPPLSTMHCSRKSDREGI
jgi:hypothetical protein